MTLEEFAAKYKPYLRSAAQQLREAANALDGGQVGRAASYTENAVTTIRWVQDDTRAADRKKKGGR